MRLRHTQYITVRGGRELIGYDDYGDPMYSDTTKRIRVHSVQPSEVEESEGRFIWSSEFKNIFSYCPLRVPSNSTVEVDGVEYQAVGETKKFLNPYTTRTLYVQSIKLVGDVRDE